MNEILSGSVSEDVVEENLTGVDAFEGITPVVDPVTQIHDGVSGTLGDGDIRREANWWRLMAARSEMNRGGDFAGGTIAMAGKSVARKIEPSIGVGRQQGATASPLDVRLETQKNGVERGIAPVTLGVRHLGVSLELATPVPQQQRTIENARETRID